MINKKFDKGIRISYSKTENVNSVKNIKHKIVKTCLKYFNVSSNIEIVSIGDIPSTGSGLGSSSSFTVGLIKGISTYIGRSLTDEDVSKIACEIEIDINKSPIGKQDQYGVNFSGINIYEFLKNEKVLRHPLKINSNILKHFTKRIFIFYTGNGRQTNQVLMKQNYKPLNQNQFNILSEISELPKILESHFLNYDPHKIGQIIQQYWELKLKLNPDSNNPLFDKVLQYSLEKGAYGGKMLGAGQAGFGMIFCDPKVMRRIEIEFKNLSFIPINCDLKGSVLIYNE